MSIIKAIDVSYVRFAVPDIRKQRSFLIDFGLTEVGEVGGTVYFRGAAPTPFCYAVREGVAAFSGFGIWARDRAAVEAIAAHDGVVVEPLDAPGGGWCARLTDPDGVRVEVVCGQTKPCPLPAPATASWNESGAVRRLAEFRRPAKGPSHVLRLGHVVFSVTNFRASEKWYKDRFGLITSDEIQPEPGVGIGAFLRADRGEDPSDHHTLFLLEHPSGPGYLHAAFEVADVDDLMVGHAHLISQGYTPQWGIGRHTLGSQIFDYWLDPFGHEIEHWTDGDQLRASDGGSVASFETLIDVQWGMPFPASAE